MSSHQSEQLATAAPAQASILLHPDEFAYDEEKRLGRANGNTYQRRPGIEHVHDGQIMIRLKKKRYIIIDYGYIPKPEDYAISNASSHISIPEGAGQQQCATKDCPRIGVPVMLYDSEPSEAMSLYLRGGLCFSCQRAVNEKRRTKRKRKPEEGLPFGEVNVGGSGDVRSLGSSGSRFKVNNEVVELNSDAIIINGAVAGTRSRGPGYQHPEIGVDLVNIMADLQKDTMSLVSNNLPTVGFSAPAATNMLYQKAFLSASRVTYLLTQWKASHDEHAYAAAAAAASAPHVPAVPPPGNGYPFDPSAVDHAVAATEAALASNNNNTTNGGAQHHNMYNMNHAMMSNAAAAGLYGMNTVHPSGGVNGNNNRGVPTLAHVPSGAAMANTKNNPQMPSKNESQSAEV
mmetsp:Transcript_4691/g.7245  ORF Transcript_4691/g.7245 Transcript_4691/m.7245 type:complete len:402 (-) Transcript_4691:125-1330(-)|eukprot:CAMPEP_0201729886 /NCGR_PEP_ID=MMETSP0593-20130828/20389_1 /ASSEMBLY_ACC=CAM_ASM_000672 /TAXON_ID=267983 /ORGANISM="Skeletonema japonicum, Strain CCMP2506" /LENGTH=401 /DNA_ID=CAMNT_0048222311 /DNA_START=213 /DNA_END=1418 /DNA_ORIENTATION=+